MITRQNTRAINLGPLKLGGGQPIRVQSMLKVPPSQSDEAIEQARRLEQCGCEIIRTAVPDASAIPFLKRLVEAVAVPIVADIHFDYRLACSAVECGIAGLRINPGNIGAIDRVRAVVDAAKSHHVPIRIGVNGGSLEKDILERHGSPTATALVESALRHIMILEKLNFDQIKVSIKASSVNRTVEAYRQFARQSDYPLHIGITEAGPAGPGTIRSAVGLGILLAEGLGDTMRVSLTAPPEEEVAVAFEILQTLEIRSFGPHLVSCPTCGRTQIDLMPLVTEVQKMIADLKEPITIAVMGCVVNGPGEAREADIGIAGGRDYGMLFKKGQPIGKYPQNKLADALRTAIDEIIAERKEADVIVGKKSMC